MAVSVDSGRDPTGAGALELVDRGALDRAWDGETTTVGPFRDALRSASEQLAERFRRNEPIETLVTARAHVIDQIIVSSWLHFAGDLSSSADLVAVGGYGRGELHPHSDIDLLVLIDNTDNDADEAIGRFLTFLWDIGLEVGHSVRTLDRLRNAGAHRRVRADDVSWRRDCCTVRAACFANYRPESA